MITFLVKKGFEYTVNEYLKSEWGDEIRDHVRVMSYSKINRISDHPQQLIVFTDHERLSNQEKKALAKIWDFLKRSYSELILYNDPNRVIVRHELLTELSNRGMNKFRSFKLNDDLSGLNYPVFIRSKFEHSGNLTNLIYSYDDLIKEIRRLIFPRNIYRKKDLLIIEFYDSKDSSGIYRKHAAYRINRVLIPRALGFSTHWMVKSGIFTNNLDHFLEKLKFVQSELENTELNSVFDIAGIDYGRIDFVFTDQNFQVWEINTNPMIEGWLYKMTEYRKERSLENIKINEEAKRTFFVRFNEQVLTLLTRNAIIVSPVPFLLLVQLKIAIYLARTRQELRHLVAEWYRLFSP